MGISDAGRLRVGRGFSSIRPKFIATGTAVLLASATLTVTAEPATAVVANVTIAGTAVSNGTTTVTYRPPATRAGTVRDIVVTIPKGSGGTVTSVNGTVRTVSAGVLRWSGGKTVEVGL